MFDRETVDRLISEFEAKDLSLYAAIASRITANKGNGFPLTKIREELRGHVGHERERSEFVRYCASRGVSVCARCGGYGGSKSWPGFTCFDCNGRGYV